MYEHFRHYGNVLKTQAQCTYTAHGTQFRINCIANGKVGVLYEKIVYNNKEHIAVCHIFFIQLVFLLLFLYFMGLVCRSTSSAHFNSDQWFIGNYKCLMIMMFLCSCWIFFFQGKYIGECTSIYLYIGHIVYPRRIL